MSMNIKEHIFFVDSHHFYLYTFAKQQVKMYKDQNCVGLFVVDNKFVYTLSHSSGEKSSGLRLYDINNILTTTAAAVTTTAAATKITASTVAIGARLDDFLVHEKYLFMVIRAIDLCS